MPAPVSPTPLTPERYQQVLDAYGIGAIRHTHTLPEVTLKDKEQRCRISRVLVETNKGLFLLAHGADEVIHPLWWDKDTEAYLHLLMTELGLTHAVLLVTLANDLFVIHRFDERFTLFRL